MMSTSIYESANGCQKFRVLTSRKARTNSPMSSSLAGQNDAVLLMDDEHAITNDRNVGHSSGARGIDLSLDRHLQSRQGRNTALFLTRPDDHVHAAVDAVVRFIEQRGAAGVRIG